MTIATVTSSPQPKPDLSSLSHGQSGNVILNAVIDTHGAITELTVVQSLTATIDQQVMATVPRVELQAGDEEWSAGDERAGDYSAL